MTSKFLETCCYLSYQAVVLKTRGIHRVGENDEKGVNRIQQNKPGQSVCDHNMFSKETQKIGLPRN